MADIEARRAERMAVRSGNDGKESLNDVVYRDIKAMILANRFRPGQKLGHWEVADVLKVSRTPVREALERLYQEGYVKRVPRRGFFVAEIDTNEAKDLYQTREALELFALDQTVRRPLSNDEITHLQRLLTDYSTLVRKRRTIERGPVDRDFHLYLAGLSGNQYIVRCLASVFERLLLKRRADGYAVDRGDRAVAEHQRLMEAIRSEDARKAKAILRAHIRDAWKAFEAHLLQMTG